MDLKSQIKKFLKGEVADDEQTLDTFSKDASIFQIKPQLIVSPLSSDDLQKLVAFVAKQSGLSLTARSAGTCMSGGAINDSIIVDMTQHFNKIIKVAVDYAVTQPGVFYRDFEKQTLTQNAILPSYTASREINTVGGMVGNNSAGEKTLSYGQTDRYVRRLKVVLVDGKEYEVKPLNKDELKKKMNQKDFEGQIYRRVYQLISDNYISIKKSKPKTSKNAAGYLLWDVWDQTTFDLTKIFVGSQGTLGIVTEIEFGLVPVKPYQKTLILEMSSLNQLDQIVNQILFFKPESLECFDNQTFNYSLRFLPELAKEFKINHGLSIYTKFIYDWFRYKLNRLPKLVLLASFTSADPNDKWQVVEATQTSLKKFNLESQVADLVAAERYWVMRRNSFNLLRHHSANMRTAPFIDDIIVRPEFLAEFLPKLDAIIFPYKKYLTYTLAGHIGDGNFHIIPLMDFTNPMTAQIIPELSEKVFKLVFEYQGSMSAEHNDGLVRGPYLPDMYGEEIYQLFKEIKSIFDPQLIFNPHKKTDATFEYSLKHIVDNHHTLHPVGS